MSAHLPLSPPSERALLGLLGWTHNAGLNVWVNWDTHLLCSPSDPPTVAVDDLGLLLLQHGWSLRVSCLPDGWTAEASPNRTLAATIPDDLGTPMVSNRATALAAVARLVLDLAASPSLWNRQTGSQWHPSAADPTPA